MGIVLLILLVLCIRACTKEEPLSAAVTDPVLDDDEIDRPPLESETDAETENEDENDVIPQIVRPVSTAQTHTLTTEIESTYGVLISMESGEILAQKAPNTRMNPASLTKVMSLIVAYEHIEDLTDTVTVTSTIIDPLYTAGASLAGFSPGEVVTVKDLLYGMILPSGAEASVALAEYVAGSEEAFVELMNEKALEMGLTSTHFENCTGLHGTNHYSTALEMAMILSYAVQYEDCLKILSTYRYTTAPTNKHPEGVSLESTMFSRMYGTEPDGVTIQAGKTGYTGGAHHCLMSYATHDVTGEAFIFVSADCMEKFGPVYDAISVYSAYANSESTKNNPSVYQP